MLTTVSLAVSLAVLSAGPEPTPPHSCEPAFAARFPALERVFAKAAGYREAASSGKRSFVDLVKQAGELRKLATRELERIQSASCALEEADTRRFEACVSPLVWSCESVPPLIDWTLLEGAAATSAARPGASPSPCCWKSRSQWGCS